MIYVKKKLNKNKVNPFFENISDRDSLINNYNSSESNINYKKYLYSLFSVFSEQAISNGLLAFGITVNLSYKLEHIILKDSIDLIQERDLFATRLGSLDFIDSLFVSCENNNNKSHPHLYV